MGTQGTAGAARTTTEASPRALRARPAPDAAAEPAVPAGAAAVLWLQRAYGNQAVQRLVPGAGGAGTGRGPRVQRWHDAEHDSSTQLGLAGSGAGPRLAQIFGGPQGLNNQAYDTEAKVAVRLGDASVNLDRFAAGPKEIADPTKETHNVGRLPTLAMFGGSMLTSAIGRGLSKAGQGISEAVGMPQKAYAVGDPLPSRGILGEGPDHAETGFYTQHESVSAPGNLARENYYIDESIKQLDAGNVDEAMNRLGDAAHVSADRGSHGEGGKGRGHDTPYPPPGREGQTLMPHYMAGWEDNDDPGMNPQGYAIGVARTAEMFQRYQAAAWARNWPRKTPPIPPRQNRAPLQNRPPVPDFDPGKYPPRGADRED